jgi:glycosyltransferase involved in cell wall biosynthesis
MPKLTLVVPVFNEELRWNSDYWGELAEYGVAHFIFVNDGSSDNSAALLREFIESHPNCSQIDLAHNRGKAEAIRLGLEQALRNNSVLVGYLDADGAFTTTEIHEICRIAETRILALQAIDSIWTSRVGLLGSNIQRKLSRHYIGRVVHTIIGLWISDLPYDSQCGFKIFRNDAYFRESVSEPFRTKWFLDLEILLQLRKRNHKVGVIEYPLQNWIDIPGSKVGFDSIPRVVKDLIALRRLSKTLSSK